MRRSKRKISLKDCYDILGLSKDAGLEDVKHAYRRKAFELHPDLNPDDPEAGRNFQLLNEAYVALSAILRARGDTEAKEATKEEKKEEEKKEEKQERPKEHYAEQDVLRDLLNDPFARRVFEDIYSELNRQQTEKEKVEPEKKKEEKPTPRPETIRPQTTEKKERVQVRPVSKTPPRRTPTPEKNASVGGLVKNWFRRQIDDELTLSLPSSCLVPGRRVRLQIRHGLSNDVHTIEVTIPADFVLGKPIRLKGLGKHIGPWQGDLYLYLQAK